MKTSYNWRIIICYWLDWLPFFYFLLHLKKPTRSTRRSANQNPPLTAHSSGGRKRTSTTGDTHRRKKQCTAATQCDPGRNDETAAAPTTADIPRIIAEVICNVSNTREDEDNNEDPPTQDEDGSSDEDESIYHNYCCCGCRPLNYCGSDFVRHIVLYIL